MSPKASAKAKNNMPSWTDAGLQGGSVMLTMVQNAAQFAPVPYLQQAAGAVLFIVNTAAKVKNNREDFERLANDAVTLVAAIWRAYELSNRKEEWPPRALRDVILEFCLTLDSIVKFAKERGSRTWILRAVYSALDSQQIMEYRERLTSAVQTFQVASDLNVNDMLSEVLDKQNKMMDQMQHNQNMLLEWHMPAKPSRPWPEEGRPQGPNSQQRIDHDEPSYPSTRWDDIQIGTSSGHASRPPDMPMSFSNIQYSGISFGNGGVNVVNGPS